MKKIGIFIATIFIALIGVFGNFNFKNSAEPNYFLQNKVLNKFVEDNTTLNLYLDNSTTYYETYTITPLFKTNKIEIYQDNNLLLTINEQTNITFMCTNSQAGNMVLFTLGNETNLMKANANDEGIGLKANEFTAIKVDANTYEIESLNCNLIKFYNVEYLEELTEINNIISPYVGNLTSLPTPQEPVSTLDQIETIITDTINWFTNIFSGLANAFYINGQLTVWGTALFIGVAIMLVMFGLKWVISLIKGI